MIKIKKQKILLKPEDIKPTSSKFEILGVLNPGAAELKDGRIVLYVRVIEKLKKFEDKKYFYSPRMVGKNNFKIVLDKFNKNSVVESTSVDFSFADGTKRLNYISHLRRIYIDESGFKILKIENKPCFFGINSDAELGVEDARITKIENFYYMTYVGLTRSGNVSTNLAVSKDCLNWKRKGIIFGEQDKDAVLFPEKINNEFVVLDRPEGGFEFTPPHIWMGYSKDLEYWGKPRPIKLPLDLNFNRSGAGPPPIKTDKGWLLIFHAVTTRKHKNFIYKLRKFFGLKVGGNLGYSHEDVYSVWAALFDKKNPEKLIAISKKPIMFPSSGRYKSFEGKDVIFPTGIVERKKYVLLFCGFGDINIGVVKIKLKNIMKSLEKV